VKASAYLSTVPSVSLNDLDNMSDKGLLHSVVRGCTTLLRSRYFVPAGHERCKCVANNINVIDFEYFNYFIV
jgi:hypothetical protein